MASLDQQQQLIRRTVLPEERKPNPGIEDINARLSNLFDMSVQLRGKKTMSINTTLNSLESIFNQISDFHSAIVDGVSLCDQAHSFKLNLSAIPERPIKAAYIIKDEDRYAVYLTKVITPDTGSGVLTADMCLTLDELTALAGDAPSKFIAEKSSSPATGGSIGLGSFKFDDAVEFLQGVVLANYSCELKNSASLHFRY